MSENQSTICQFPSQEEKYRVMLYESSTDLTNGRIILSGTFENCLAKAWSLIHHYGMPGALVDIEHHDGGQWSSVWDH